MHESAGLAADVLIEQFGQLKSIYGEESSQIGTKEPAPIAGLADQQQQTFELAATAAASAATQNTSLAASPNQGYGYFRHSLTVSVILTIAYSIVFIVGIIGNSVVVAIVCKSPRMRTVTNYFIANLALADILVLLFCLPATLVGNLFVRK